MLWNKVFYFKGDHQLWYSPEINKYSISDCSESNLGPDFMKDGPLLIDEKRPIFWYKDKVSFPVIHSRSNKEKQVFSSFEFAFKFFEALPKLKKNIEIEPEMKDTMLKLMSLLIR